MYGVQHARLDSDWGQAGKTSCTGIIRDRSWMSNLCRWVKRHAYVHNDMKPICINRLVNIITVVADDLAPNRRQVISNNHADAGSTTIPGNDYTKTSCTGSCLNDDLLSRIFVSVYSVTWTTCVIIELVAHCRGRQPGGRLNIKIWLY